MSEEVIVGKVFAVMREEMTDEVVSPPALSSREGAAGAWWGGEQRL